MNKLAADNQSEKAATGKGRFFTADEVARHNTKEDCWTIFEGKVYDVTTYLDDHPGGADRLLSVAGRDGTTDFNKAEHSGNARNIRDKYLLGNLKGYNPPKPRISSELWGMLALTALVVAFSVYFFSTRK